MLRLYLMTIPNHNGGDHLLHRIPPDFRATLQTCLRSRPRPQQPQEISDFGGRSHGRTARRGRILLLYRDRRRQTYHRIDQRLRHPFEELLGVRRERLDVPALPLGVERIERERAFPRARRARDDRDRPPWKLDSEALEIMLAYVAENDAIRGMAHNPQN